MTSFGGWKWPAVQQWYTPHQYAYNNITQVKQNGENLVK